VSEKNVENYAVGIIGGGPGGYVAAIRAAQSGLKTVLFEKDELGGTCLNRGCIPTKTLLQSIKAKQELKKLARWGITGVDLNAVKLDWSKMQSNKMRTQRRLTLGVANLLKTWGVKVVRGKAVLEEDPHLVQVAAEKYRVENLIIATGSKPRTLKIPGLETAEVLKSDQALTLKEVPASLVILGGGVIGIEFAFIFRALGVEVTIIEREKNLLPRLDTELVEELTRDLRGQGITLYTNTETLRVEKETLLIKNKGEIKELQAEKILVAAGRTPSYPGLNVEKLGLELTKGGIKTDAFLRTNLSRVYALGDVNGKWLLAHKAIAEGLFVIDHLLGKSEPMNYAVIPQCIYSLPEIASVGLTENEAREKYGVLKIAHYPFAANGRAQIMEERKGFIKVIADQTAEKILGVHIWGPQATELISQVIVALNLKATPNDLANYIYPHPTISEAMGEAYQAIEQKAIHLPK